MKSDKTNLKLLLSLAIDYVRWTQLTPMLLTWSVALLMLAAMTLVNFQAQSLSAAQVVIHWLTQLPILGHHVNEWLSQSASGGHISGDNFKVFVMTAWSVLSLAFMLLGMVLPSLFKPLQVWSLKRKLLGVGIGVVLLLAGLISNYFTHIEKFNGETSGWMLNFSALALIVFLVSLYSLSIAHFLRNVQLWLNRNDQVLVSVDVID